MIKLAPANLTAKTSRYAALSIARVFSPVRLFVVSMRSNGVINAPRSDLVLRRPKYLAKTSNDVVLTR